MGPGPLPASPPGASSGTPEFLFPAQVQGQCSIKAELHWLLQESGLSSQLEARPSQGGAWGQLLSWACGHWASQRVGSWAAPAALCLWGAAPQERGLSGCFSAHISWKGYGSLHQDPRSPSEALGAERGISLKGGEVQRWVPVAAGFKPGGPWAQLCPACVPPPRKQGVAASLFIHADRG